MISMEQILRWLYWSIRQTDSAWRLRWYLPIIKHNKCGQEKEKLNQLWYIPVIILTLTPRSRALLIVSALSWRGGSKRGRRPMNSQGPPGLSLVAAGTSYRWHSSFFNKGNKEMEIQEIIGFMNMSLPVEQLLRIAVHAQQICQSLSEPFSLYLLCSRPN